MKDLRLLAVGTVAGARGGVRQQRAAPSAGPPPGAKRVDRSEGREAWPAASMLEGSAPANPAGEDVGGPVLHVAEPERRDLRELTSSTDGGLENVFVYVKDGLGNYYFDAPTDPAKLDQQGCRYRPHVLGVRTSQPLEISNSDDTHAQRACDARRRTGSSTSGRRSSTRWTGGRSRHKR